VTSPDGRRATRSRRLGVFMPPLTLADAGADGTSVRLAMTGVPPPLWSGVRSDI
jgi:hypothetical protein